MKIAVIDNYDSFVFNLVRYVREYENTETVVMRNRKIDYDILNQVDGILLSPGPGIPSEAGDLMKIIAEYKTQKPILGVCLGHQAIGEHFNMRLMKAKEIIHGKSTKIEIINSNPLFDDLVKNGEISAGRYHSWILEETMSQSDLKISAQTSEGEIMAIHHRDLPIYGLQFHPESVLTPLGRKMINNWITSLS